MNAVASGDSFDNRLIFGDNLLALKALEQEFAGKIKCIYIDPPYNTGSAFAQYDDGVEHSLWLSLMRDRLEILRQLLAEDGVIWINLDDNEAHYCKVLCDEAFGRPNFVANVLWQKRTSPDMRAWLGAGHDHILVYAKNISKMQLNRLQKTSEQIAQYKNPDNDLRGPWVSSDYTAQGFRPNQMYKIKTPGGKVYTPPKGVCWKNVETVFLELVADNRIWFGKDGNAMPRRKTFLSESQGNQSWTWWTNEEVSHTQEAKKESIALFGEDKGGITEAAGWKGGGGFRYYRLAPSLLEKDQFGNWVISKQYNAAMLAEAVCKLEGFTYAPSDTVYWQHGRSTEKDFIYVTTQTLTREQIQKLSDEVGEERSLLVLCGAFRVKNLDAFPNLTVKKIPKTVLSRCEWGKDDYSLEIAHLPMREAVSDQQSAVSDEESGQQQRPETKAQRRATVQQPSLFDLPAGKEGAK